ncbi:HNH endonuclease [Weissella confusa]|uniref:HNH domain-containing protein n=1 Tax=Weissella confusa TaxID=1583 RepID=A0AAJ2Z216_WEICO|nr:HNH endonuclease [Weissella confusa]NBA12575.1 hypothetical protein [Weissella confusa]
MFKYLSKPVANVETIGDEVTSSYQRRSKWGEVADDPMFWDPFKTAEDEYKKLGTAFYTIPAQRNVNSDAANYFFDNKIGEFRKSQMTTFGVRKMCSVCEQTIVSQLDHVLPRSIFPDLTLVPINLVPLCSICNENKLDKWGGVNNPVYNQYIDDVSLDVDDFEFSFLNEENNFSIQLVYLGSNSRLKTNIFDIYKLHITMQTDAPHLLQEMVNAVALTNERTKELSNNIETYAMSQIEQGFKDMMFPEVSRIFFNSVLKNLETFVSFWPTILEELY